MKTTSLFETEIGIALRRETEARTISHEESVMVIIEVAEVPVTRIGPVLSEREFSPQVVAFELISRAPFDKSHSMGTLEVTLLEFQIEDGQKGKITE
jgi:hypothetical protein